LNVTLVLTILIDEQVRGFRNPQFVTVGCGSPCPKIPPQVFPANSATSLISFFPRKRDMSIVLVVRNFLVNLMDHGFPSLDFFICRSTFPFVVTPSSPVSNAFCGRLSPPFLTHLRHSELRFVVTFWFFPSLLPFCLPGHREHGEAVFSPTQNVHITLFDLFWLYDSAFLCYLPHQRIS